MNQITLSHTAQGWMAEYHGEERATIVNLFGTAIIPSGFTARATWQYVKREIERLNPGYLVEVR